MQARLTARPADQVIAAIHALDLESVKSRVMDAELGEGWSREYADSIEAAYRTYLTMLVKYPDDAEDILLSKDVDEFWHTHILQTRKYLEDCQNAFGAFLHHEPHVGKVTAADHEKRAVLAEKTRRLYEREFGAAECEAAWAGGQQAAAFSSAAIRPQPAAFSSAGVEERNAAFSSASIQPRNAAFSSAAIQARHAAFSSASVEERNAAFSSASIQPRNAAFSSAAIEAGKAAFSSAGIEAEHAAFSSAGIHPRLAAFSSASIRAENAAFSSAALKG